MRLKSFLYYLLLALVGATVAGWLKVPLSIWWAEPLRNKLGLATGVALFELFRLWPYYLLGIGALAVLAPWVARTAQARRVALLLGTALGALLLAGYCLFRGYSYGRIYALHALAGEPQKPWYTWLEWPYDVWLLLIYSIAGFCVGWCYYQWLIRPKREAPQAALT